MKKHKLGVAKREVFGRKVNKLRREGIMPGTIYGKKVKSVSIQFPISEFQTVYKEAGETGVIELIIDGSNKDDRTVLIHNVQLDPVKDTLVHAEFRQVDLKEKVEATVPLEQVGEAPAVEQKKGVLLTIATTLEVEALPTNLPDKIEVDLSSLTEEGSEITIGNLKIPAEVTVLTDKKAPVVKIAPLVTKEAEQQVAEESAAAEEASQEVKEGEEPVAAEEKEGEEQSKEATTEEGKKEEQSAKQEKKEQ